MALLAFGCGGKMMPAPYSTQPPVVGVKLAPGDMVDVRFADMPELDVSTRVRPDGKISLQRIDDVDVLGLTPLELDAKLTKAYKDKGNMVSPVLSVFVTEIISRRVYVGGEVRGPGMLQMTDGMTALEAVVAAGGLIRETAKPKTTVLLRHANGKREAMLIDLAMPMKSPESGVVYLEPLDIVYVPRTRISKANQWVQQYITNMIPGLGGLGGIVGP